MDIVRRLRASQSIRAIQRETGVHRATIRQIASIAAEAGWLDPQGRLPEFEAVAAVLGERWRAASTATHPLDAFADKVERWLKDGYSYVAIHTLLCDLYPCSEATVRRYIKRTFPHLPKPVVHRETCPGACMEVDFSELGITYDPVEGRNRKTYVFSGRLRHSRKAYRERVYSQNKMVFFACHIHAFEYFGGVPYTVVPDNLKAAVIVASFEDPIVNRAYHDLAIHYGFVISPCAPNTPQHKGGVESDMGYIKRNFWPVFRARQRELGREVPDGDDLAVALAEWSNNTADVRTVKGIGIVPQEVFEREEKPALKPLPPLRWDPLTVGTAKVQEGWRIQFECAYYSVPYRYIGEQVSILANQQRVRIFHQHKQIADHPRATRRWQILRSQLHAPPAAEKMLETTREGLLRWAANISEPVRRVAEAIFARAGVDGLRPVRGLLHLARSHGEHRLTAACTRALAFERPEYRCVKNILAQRLDCLEEEGPTVQQSSGQYSFRFARRPGYFNPVSTEDTHG
jgi:transposase